MNFALDAIWWKLKNPHVRQLAALLISPPVWNNPFEAPVRTLLSDTGFRRLLELDKNPVIFQCFNQKTPPEKYLSLWLDKAQISPVSETLYLISTHHQAYLLMAKHWVFERDEVLWKQTICDAQNFIQHHHHIQMISRGCVFGKARPQSISSTAWTGTCVDQLPENTCAISENLFAPFQSMHSTDSLDRGSPPFWVQYQIRNAIQCEVARFYSPKGSP